MWGHLCPIPQELEAKIKSKKVVEPYELLKPSMKSSVSISKMYVGYAGPRAHGRVWRGAVLSWVTFGALPRAARPFGACGGGPSGG